MQLYSKIYQVSEANMQVGNQKFSFSEKVFKAILYKNPEIIDVSEFENVKIEDFLNIAYLRLLNRLPDEERKCSFLEMFLGMGEDELLVKYEILLTIYKSSEFKQKGKKLIGLKRISKKLKARGKVRRTSFFFEVMKSKLRCFICNYFIYPIWRIMSANLKNKIRSMIRREMK